MSKLCTVIFLWFSVTSVYAAEYYFSQTGFDQGASLSGSFQATDLNSNGLIQGSIFTDFTEISNFSISFTGNDIAPAFTQTLSDLSYLGYALSKSFLGDANPEGMATNWFGTSGYTYVSGVYTNGQQGGAIINWATGLTTETSHLVTVSTTAPVPVPGAISLFLPVFAGLFKLGRRQYR